MASRNRGKPKPKLRDLSQHPLTPEERKALVGALQLDVHPITCAILGAIFVEHELERILRSRFRRNDDDTWFELLSDNGPLSSFFAKIMMGYAFRLYDEQIRDNLNIVRSIRNAFAHSKKLIDFDHELIVAELGKAKPKRGSLLGIVSKLKHDPSYAKVTYLVLCFSLSSALLERHFRALSARAKRASRKEARVRWAGLVAALIPRDPTPQEAERFGLLASLGRQSGDPKPATPLGLLGVLFQEPPKSGGNEDK